MYTTAGIYSAIQASFDEYDEKCREAARLRTDEKYIEASIEFENAAELAMNNVDEWHCRRNRDECIELEKRKAVQVE